MDHMLQVALQKLQENSASDEDIDLIRKAISSGQISIGGSVQNSVIILGSGNIVQLSVKNHGQLTKQLPVFTSVRTSTKPIKRPYFIGRTEELKEFQSVWENVKIHKELQFVLVEGIPGAGKTALVEMFLKRVIANHHSFFQVKCINKNIGDPLVPFEEMFPQLNNSSNEIKQQKGTDIQLTAKFKQLTDFIKKKAKARNGLILFFDDIQWMDETSMSLLQNMREVLIDCPILIILAYRSTELKKRTPVYKLLLDLKHTASPKIIEVPFGISVLDYVNQRFPSNLFDPKFVRTIQEKTKGYAFMVSVFFDNLIQKGVIYEDRQRGSWSLRDTEIVIPNDAWQLIEEQVKDIKREHLELIRIASTEGEVFTFELLCVVKNLPQEFVVTGLEDFEDLEILRRPGKYTSFNGEYILQYRFTHSLYREYFYSQAQHASEQVKNHRDLAQAIQTFYGENLEEVANQLAEHYELSYDWKNAFDFSLLAGEAAKKKFSRKQEKAWAGKCLDFMKKLGDHNTDIAKRCRVAIMWADGPTESPKELKNNEKLLKQNISLLVDEAFKRLKCEALIALAYVQYEIGTAEGVETAQEATQLAEEIGDLKLKYEAISILSDIWCDNEENFDKSEKTNLEAIQIAKQLGDSYRLASTQASYAWLLTDLGRVEDSCKYAEEAVKLIGSEDFPDDKNIKAYIYRMAGTAYEAKREFKHALLRYRKALRLYTELGAKVKICWMYYDLGDCLAQAHRHRAAVYFFDKCIKHAKEIGNLDTKLWSLVSWADIDLLEDRVEMAAKRLEDAKEIIEDPERRATVQDVIEYKTSLSMLKFLQGDPESAILLAHEVIREAKYPVDHFFSNLNLGKYLMGTDPDSDALEQLNQSAQIALKMNDPIWLTLAHDQIGDHYLFNKNFWKAVQHYEYAIRTVAEIYHRSGIDKIRRKMDYAKEYIKENMLKSSNNIISLSRTFIASNGHVAISYVNHDIFLKKYFTHCLECGFCQDSCCSYGTDIDIINMENLKKLKEEIMPFIRETNQDWFDPNLKYDAEFPGNQYSRTTVLGSRCIFISKDQRGCGLQRYAISKRKDYHTIKPLVCILFPVTFENGILTLSTELEDDSLVCSGSGYSAYQGVHKELEYYFGHEFVQELDEIEKRTLLQSTEGGI